MGKARYPWIPLAAKSLFLRQWFRYRQFFGVSKTFSYQGKIYRYFEHPYHSTWINERGVEIPIIQGMVQIHHDKRILEVGNVLSHYFPVTHDVIDKYEKGDRIINQDIIDFHPAQQYDLIISISTLEHIGWDETPRDPTKILRTIDNLKSLLAPGGKIVATIPMGYNPELDKMLNTNKIDFFEMSCWKRIQRVNGWTETTWEDVRYAKYHSPFNNANALVIGVINNLAKTESVIDGHER